MPNALVPISVTESGISTSEKQLQLNASLPIVFRLLPSFTVLALLPLKASLPIVVTESGIVMDFRRTQVKNACSPISFSVDGSVTAVREEQFRNAPLEMVCKPSAN